jgi:hypothetical protein
MATLLTICQNAIQDIGDTAVPTTIAGNTNPTAVQLLALANRGGKALALKHDWDELIYEHTFTTADGTAGYALPSDFRKFAFLTYWDRTNLRNVFGPITPREWQYLTSSGVSTAAVDRAFRVMRSEFKIFPTPDVTGDTIAFEYYSKNWCESSGGTGQEAFAADADVPRLDEELLTLDIRWRYLASKGEAYEEEYSEWMAYRDTLLANQNGPKGMKFDNGGITMWVTEVPETGYGA